MPNSDLTVILPTYNERENTGFWNLLKEIKKLELNPKIIVVDDGDDFLHEQLDKDVIYLRGKKGESESIEYALEQVPTTYVTIMDSDGSHPASFITESYKEIIENEAEIVVGSRYEKEGRSNATYINRTISRISNKFANWTLGQRKISSDLTGRLLTSTREIFLKYDIWYGRGDAAIAFLYKAKKEGIRIKDIPISYTRRYAGSGSTDSFKGIIEFLFLYFIRVFSIKFDKYKPYSDRWIERAKHDWSIEDYKIKHRTMLLSTLLIIPYSFIYLLSYLPTFNTIAIIWPDTPLGFLLRSIYWNRKLGYCGQDILIGRNTVFFNPENIVLEGRNIIDHNVTIIANRPVYLDKEVTIHSNCYLNLKLGAWLDEKSCIGHGCYIFTSTNLPGYSFSYATRPKDQKIEGKEFRLGKNSFIGTNSTVIASQIDKDTVIGANSFVRENRAHSGTIIQYSCRPTSEINK